MWNIENEHVNNVGQFRAVRDISLYPVDLTDQAELEDIDDPTNSVGGNLSVEGYWRVGDHQVRRGQSYTNSPMLCFARSIMGWEETVVSFSYNNNYCICVSSSKLSYCRYQTLIRYIILTIILWCHALQYISPT